MNKQTEIQNLIKNKSAEEILQTLSQISSESVVFSTSLGYEDQVLTHMMFSNNLNISVFTLDTGRLFPETYSVLNSTISRYKKLIQVFYPSTSAVENLVSQKGPFSFYDSADNRKECCYIRKVEPLKRAL
ncbi:MAG: phosphoadenosine phosphosulfate reductase family protein, partial [Bacteroidia bacterium]|nr:phosphoadenosine phosphosulfate reductase family protein [Bacteroidia bacterium]